MSLSSIMAMQMQGQGGSGADADGVGAAMMSRFGRGGWADSDAR